MANTNRAAAEDEIPEFLIVLGLRQPVTVEDVKQAYLEKAKRAHPDHGGDAQQFVRLQQAFEQATEYARFKAGRMKWLSGWVEQYAEQQQFIDQIRALGGTIEVESVDWMARTVGADFATVLERVTSLHLDGAKIDNHTVQTLVEQRRTLAAMHRLGLTNTRVTDEGLVLLTAFDNLREIDLSGTKVDLDSVEYLLASLKSLKSLKLADCGIGRFAQIKFRLTHRDIEVAF